MSDLLDAHPERLLQELAGACCHGYHEDAVVITACSAIIRFRRSLSFEQALAHRKLVGAVAFLVVVVGLVEPWPV